MSLLSKVRGLWRFDGDEEPVQVSRRSFLFMGATVAAGAAIPAIFAPEPLILTVSATADADGGITYNWTTEALFKERYREVIPAMFNAEPMQAEYLRRLKKSMKLYRGRSFAPNIDGEWILSEDHPIITGKFKG